MATFVVLCVALRLAVRASAPPHIALIVSDDLGWDDLGFRWALPRDSLVHSLSLAAKPRYVINLLVQHHRRNLFCTFFCVLLFTECTHRIIEVFSASAVENASANSRDMILHGRDVSTLLSLPTSHRARTSQGRTKSERQISIAWLGKDVCSTTTTFRTCVHRAVRVSRPVGECIHPVYQRHVNKSHL